MWFPVHGPIFVTEESICSEKEAGSEEEEEFQEEFYFMT